MDPSPEVQKKKYSFKCQLYYSDCDSCVVARVAVEYMDSKINSIILILVS